MFLRILARKGHYNLCDPSEEKWSINFELVDGEKSTNLRFTLKDYTPSDQSLTDVEEAKELIDQWRKEIWVSTQRTEIDAFEKYLLEHEDEISKGNMEEKLRQLEAEHEKIEKRISDLKRYINQ